MGDRRTGCEAMKPILKIKGYVKATYVKRDSLILLQKFALLDNADRVRLGDNKLALRIDGTVMIEFAHTRKIHKFAAMGAVLYYSVLGTFICTGILLGTTFLIVLDIVDEIGEFRNVVEEDLNQFKSYADDAWLVMMTTNQAPSAKRHSAFYESIVRIKRQGSYTEGGGSVISGGEGCQCAAQAASCPRGPPGPPGQAGIPGEDGYDGAPGRAGGAGQAY
ncbi:nematode cuticle collagen domain protein, partial [Teladorsagia circumcincta]